MPRRDSATPVRKSRSGVRRTKTKAPEPVMLVARRSVLVQLAEGETYPVLAGVTRLRSDHPAAVAAPEAFVAVSKAR